jgi:hypothetical protein
LCEVWVVDDPGGPEKAPPPRNDIDSESDDDGDGDDDDDDTDKDEADSNGI